jgi:16S rRNA (adenine1518-N6/adenine1519-N6)-dimethyltransferase
VIRSRKRFGQHFLEAPWVEKVILAIDPRPTDVFLEIGPGRGALTRPLAARVRRVTAVEIDRDLAAELRDTAPPNVSVVEGDFLDSPASLLPGGAMIRVAGNLPYNVASPILFKLVEWFAQGQALVDATLMLQREVAERLGAVPGTKDYGVLTVLIGHASSVKRVLALPPGAFRPAPKVNSALVQLRFHAPDPPVSDPAVFAGLVQAVFTRRRKTLSNALDAFDLTKSAGRQVLERAGIDGQRRPETLTIAEFARLADAYAGV